MKRGPRPFHRQTSSVAAFIPSIAAASTVLNNDIGLLRCVKIGILFFSLCNCLYCQNRLIITFFSNFFSSSLPCKIQKKSPIKRGVSSLYRASTNPRNTHGGNLQSELDIRPDKDECYSSLNRAFNNSPCEQEGYRQFRLYYRPDKKKVFLFQPGFNLSPQIRGGYLLSVLQPTIYCVFQFYSLQLNNIQPYRVSQD